MHLGVPVKLGASFMQGASHVADDTSYLQGECASLNLLLQLPDCRPLWVPGGPRLPYSLLGRRQSRQRLHSMCDNKRYG